MMGLLYKKAVGLPEEKKTAEIKAMIETYNQKVNFVDFESLNRLTECIYYARKQKFTKAYKAQHTKKN